MSTNKTALITKIEALVQDNANKLTHTVGGEFGIAMDLATEYYSKIKAYEKNVTYDGDGEAYNFEVPSDFIQGFSQIVRVEYVFPAESREPEVIQDINIPSNPEEVFLYRDENDTWMFRFRTITPEAAGTNANIKITYSTTHTLDDDTSSDSTIPLSDVQALTLLSASYVCEMLSSIYAETSNPNINVDLVNFRSKSAEYAARAKQFKKLAEELLSLGMGGEGSSQYLSPKAASSTADWDLGLRIGRGYLFRGGSVR